MKNTKTEPSPWIRAYIVFEGTPHLWGSHFLCPGFRHCFALLWDGRLWLKAEATRRGLCLYPYYHVNTLGLKQQLARQGYRVICVKEFQKIGAVSPFWGWLQRVLHPISCVSLIKDILGIMAPGVLTPWQLYQYLKAP